MDTLLTDLLEYASAVAAAKEAERKTIASAEESERRDRKAAFEKLTKNNPALADLLVAIVAREWHEAVRQIEKMQGELTAEQPSSEQPSRD